MISWRIGALAFACGIMAACSADEEVKPVEEASAPVSDTDDSRLPADLYVPEGVPQADQALVGPIDWAAARADFQRARGGTDEGVVSTASGEVTPVPILLPSGIVSVQSGRDVRFRPLQDGYFATYPGPVYDIIVNGTNQTAGVDGAERKPRGDTMAFTATAGGAQVALSRYGADYLIEFECRNIEPDTGTCIAEAEALEIANGLIVAGTR